MPQQFRTKNVGDYAPALYQLSIRAPGEAFAEVATYTFPITPTQLRIRRRSMTSFSDTQGPAGLQGVARIFDVFGYAPPTFTIEGTTGWDRHASDGYVLTGLQSMQLLQQFIERYKQLNEIQRESGNPFLFALEFYDYFGNNFWQVEPVGEQGFNQSADRTKLVFYRFFWVGVRPVGLPALGEADALLTTFATPALTAAIAAARTLNAMALAYTPVGFSPELG